MSNIEQAKVDIQKMEDHYLKVDLIHFFAVVLVLAAIIAALAIWDSKAHILAPFTTNLLNFFKIQL